MFQKLFGPRQFQYTCKCCGTKQIGAPSFSLPFPCYVNDVPTSEREQRVKASEDLVVIQPKPNDPDGEAIYCIRTILEIPIKGSSDQFSWGVWVTQSKASFERYVRSFNEDQSQVGSFGWLPVDLAQYNASPEGAELVHLECDVEWGAIGQRPKLRLWDNDHPLVLDQRNGISWKKAVKIAEAICPKHGSRAD
jgi:hypothetical protein